MKMKQALLALHLSLAAVPALAADLSALYVPTRAEWLQVALRDSITQVTDLWERRAAVSVAVVPGEQRIDVLLSFPKPPVDLKDKGKGAAQTDPSQEEKNAYVRSVEGVTMALLNRYPWTEGMKVLVQVK